MADRRNPRFSDYYLNKHDDAIITELGAVEGAKYRMARTEENHDRNLEIVQITKDLIGLEYELNNEHNFLKPVTGRLTMEELRWMKQMEEEEPGCTKPIPERVIRFAVANMANENWTHEHDTIVFELNAFGIDSPSLIKSAVENYMTGAGQPIDIFEREYLMIPSMHIGFMHCTIVLNAKALLKRGTKNGKCTMVHLTTINDTSYKVDQLNRIMMVLRAFASFTGDNGELVGKQVDHIYEELPRGMVYKNPLMVLNLMEKILQPHFYFVKWRNALDELVEDREDMKHQMRLMRDKIYGDLRDLVNSREKTHPMIHWLYYKVQTICENAEYHQKEMSKQDAEDRMSRINDAVSQGVSFR